MKINHQFIQKTRLLAVMGIISYGSMTHVSQAEDLIHRSPEHVPCKYILATRSMVCGNATVTNGLDSTKNAISIGDGSVAGGNQSLALGSWTKASQNNSIAIGAGDSSGNGARALSTNAIAIGKNSEITSTVEWYVGQEGNYKKAPSENSIAIGVNTRIDGAPNAIVIGNGAKIHRNRNYTAYWHDTSGSVAIGHNAEILANDANTGAIAYTDQIQAPKQGSWGGATAVGHNAKTSVGGATALGAARANAVRSIAIGAWGNTTLGKLYAETRAANSMAIGDQALVGKLAHSGQAIGGGATVLPNSVGAIAFGAGTVTQGQGAVAIGGSTGTISNGTAVNDYLIVPREKAAVAAAENSVSLATNARVFAGSTSGIAIGEGSQVGQGEVEIDAETRIPTKVTGTQLAENGIAIGKNVKVLAKDAVAIGHDNYINSQNTYVLGYGINMKPDGSLIGNTVANSVYLGANSQATAGATVGSKNINREGEQGDTTTAGDKGVVAKTRVGNITYGHFSGSVSDGVITVGAAGSERRIQNLAAGEISSTSTDAINGSQLYAVAEQFSNIPFVYTDKQNNKLVKASDGKYYLQRDVGLNGTPNSGAIAVNNKDIIVSVQTVEGKLDRNIVIRNVAKGDISKNSVDAVNGGQLYAQGEALKNIIGGNTTYDPQTGKFINNNIGGTGKSNINDAIAALNTATAEAKSTVTAGNDNIVVTATANKDGGHNYAVSTAKNLTADNFIAEKTRIDSRGITISNSDSNKVVSLTDIGLNNGNNQIINVASGLGNKTLQDIRDAVTRGDTVTEINNAANIGDLLSIQNNLGDVTNNFQETLGKEYVNADGSLTDKGKDALITYEVSGQRERQNSNIIDALVQIKEQGTKYFHVNGGQKQEGTRSNNKDANAEGRYSTSIGFQSNSIGENAIAIGKGAQAKGNNSISIGTGNEVSGEGSGAFGDPSIVTGDSAYSVGNHNKISTDSTYALGSQITETISNSVFLGDKASSKGVHTTANGGTYTYKGKNDANVAGVVNTKGVVSVGSERETRQIQHVAAGVVSSNSTDAINGSQLYDTYKAITNISNELHNINNDLRAGIASSAALGMLPQPTLPGKSMVSIGGTSYRNQGAIAVGISSISDNEKWVLKLGASTNTRQNYIVGGSVGYQW